MAKIAYLDLFGEVGKPDVFMMMFGTSPESFIDADKVNTFIKENQAADTFEVQLRTRGGDVDEGYAIRESLIASGKKIIVKAVGYVMSIGVVIMGAAKKENTFITSDSEYLAHNPYFPDQSIGGNAEELQSYADEMLKIENKIANTLVTDTGLPLDEIKILMKEDKPISGKEAVEKGLVGNLIDTKKKNEYAKLKAVAFNAEIINLKNKNKMANEKDMSAIDKIVNKFEGLLKKAKLIAVNFELTDVKGNTLTVEREDENVTVGDKASPDGTFTLETGKVITVLNGEVTKVDEPANELEKLKTENADLKKQLDDLNGTVDKYKATEAENAEIMKEVVNIKNDLKKIKASNVDPEKKAFDKVSTPAPKTDAEIREEVKKFRKIQ